jgi:hypothetical protein
VTCSHRRVSAEARNAGAAPVAGCQHVELLRAEGLVSAKPAYRCALPNWIAANMRDGEVAAEQVRQHTGAQLTKRRHEMQTKLDRGYEDDLEGKISEVFWARKSSEWESELATIEG